MSPLASEIQGDLSNVEEAMDIFDGCNTLVHFGDGTIGKFNIKTIVDVLTLGGKV